MRQFKSKVFRDPIYGYIHVDHEFILNLIDSKAFQRLRRIKQLSGVQMVFHGAEHSRFSHSLGVYENAYKFSNISDIKNSLTEREKMLFLAVALLHDIGHGPYSHSFEDAFNVDHEEIGANIVLKDLEINEILNEIDANFAKDVSDIILKQSKFNLIEQLISSQLDVDRLDYLVRDAYYAGVTYGTIDLDRIMRVLRIREGKVVFKSSGIHAIENYLISRYHMYWQVYYHRKARAYEVILSKIYFRVKELIENKYKFTHDITILEKLIYRPDDINNILLVDDYYINGLIRSFVNEEDEVLNCLANDFLNRKMWNTIFDDETNKDKIDKIINSYNESERKYFTAQTTAHESTYIDYDESLGEQIFILLEDGVVSTLADESKMIKSLLTSGTKKEPLFFYRNKDAK